MITNRITTTKEYICKTNIIVRLYLKKCLKMSIYDYIY
jgi:hypothetical protein